MKLAYLLKKKTNKLTFINKEMLFLNFFAYIENAVAEGTIVWIQILANSCVCMCVTSRRSGQCSLRKCFQVDFFCQRQLDITVSRKVVSGFVSVKNVFLHSCYSLLIC